MYCRMVIVYHMKMSLDSSDKHNRRVFSHAITKLSYLYVWKKKHEARKNMETMEWIAMEFSSDVAFYFHFGDPLTLKVTPASDQVEFVQSFGL